MKKLRCAIYTRKSSDEGLEQDFNSLDAQREACAAFVVSQKHEGWVELSDRYDDGGFSGGNMDRPGLKKLLGDIREKRVDVIVVYKVDRLTRSLADFAKIVEVLDEHGISFVAVTQQFNTTTSMGRLTLNVLLSFAQFEREIAGERIRDKVKASRQKGMWMGGNVPLGYEVQNRALVINEKEAAKVRFIFQRYLDLRSVNPLYVELRTKGITSHRRTTQDGKLIGGNAISRGNIYIILRNPVYIGQVAHKGTVYPGLHEPIIDQDTWDRVQRTLEENRSGHQQQLRSKLPSLLSGIVFDEAGGRLTPSHTNKYGARYRYYVSKSRLYGRPRADEQDKRWRVPGAELDGVVLTAVRSLLTDHNELSAVLSLGRLSPAEANAVFASASVFAGDLSIESPAVLRKMLGPLLRRVEIADASLTVSLALGPLGEALGLARTVEDDAGTHSIIVPVRVTKRGVEQRLVVGDHNGAKVRDAALIRAVARAHAWAEDLMTGAARDLTEIAERTALPPAYIRAHLPLAFLAPNIVAAIIEGRQPIDVTAKRVMYQISLPIEWDEQQRVLGIGA
jgi:site-specific DNA recombinase